MEAQDFPPGFDWIGDMPVEVPEIEPEPEPHQPQVRPMVSPGGP